MDVAHGADDGQTLDWNGVAGRSWIETQALIGRMFKPLEELLVEMVAAGSGTQVLDVGCGTGGTTLAVARRLGAQSHCIGVDISEPMIAAARTRAEQAGTPAGFIRANAQTCSFEPASFDMIISRFGVMFFDDFVQAFANLRRAVKTGAELRFIAWRSPGENPFMTTAERAAAPLLPNLPARRQDVPGQFAFADEHRVRRILEESGWMRIDIQPIDVACTLPENELVRYFTLLGPVGRALDGTDDRIRAQVIEAVRPAFNPFVHGAEVRFTAACWAVSARAPSASVVSKEVPNG